MKFTAAIVAALATVAAAAPSGKCKPATYSCTPDNEGWQVCNTSGKWVFAGDCPPDTLCKFYKPSASPYCVPPGFKFPQ